MEAPGAAPGESGWVDCGDASMGLADALCLSPETTAANILWISPAKCAVSTDYCLRSMTNPLTD